VVRPRLASLLAAVLLCLGGCSFGITISVSGSLTEGVRFAASCPASLLETVRLERLLVTRTDGTPGGGEEVVWDVVGAGRIARVTYGEVPPGFVEVAKATDLRLAGSYRVYAVASSGWISGGGSADCEFSFGGSGAVRPGVGCQQGRQ
jgi:hypothetical protein